MYDAKIKQLWEGEKVMKKLKSLELISANLRTINVGLFPNLERLDLEGCHYLEELTVPVGGLNSLVHLNLSSCPNLQSLSFIKQLESLEVLHLSEYFPTEFPDIVPTGSSNYSLLELDISYSRIEEIPSSIGIFCKLVYLNLSGCGKLKSLSRSFCSLQSLITLVLVSSGIEELPDNIGLLKSLQALDLRFTHVNIYLIVFLPENLGQLDSLEVLDPSYCWLRDIPNSICMLKHLKKLKIEYCHSITKLPEEIGDIECLEELNVTCTGISHLPRSISLLKGLKIIGFEPGSQIMEEPLDKEPSKRQRRKDYAAPPLKKIKMEPYTPKKIKTEPYLVYHQLLKTSLDTSTSDPDYVLKTVPQGSLTNDNEMRIWELILLDLEKNSTSRFTYR
ncbi:NB-ARC domains-containing protein [Artemisia annua]|uniref:NB-ARC domains-containing protein n=1 Tax=Artemisia annua TaxID=35608 RepID=A0A2U1KKN8_ARTAN|nr:NB-ARC domains-containing protein [Artemisia annua]